MRRVMILLLLVSGAMLVGGPARSAGMKSSAPERMLRTNEAKKMRVCNARAMKEKIPMERRARFVKECMAKMK